MRRSHQRVVVEGVPEYIFRPGVRIVGEVGEGAQVTWFRESDRAVQWVELPFAGSLTSSVLEVPGVGRFDKLITETGREKWIWADDWRQHGSRAA